MELSVVVATLNDRDALADSLDGLATAVPSAELIVVNGPSADGTSGMVRDRTDVDLLLELADRNLNVARNAGAATASGEVVAFVDERTEVSTGWGDGLEAALDADPVATGPIRQALPVGRETSRPERDRIGGRPVTFFDGANVAFRREVLVTIDGFDENLTEGGARDAAHRLAGLGIDVGWSSTVRADRRRIAPGPRTDADQRAKNYALAYRLAKNYGISPTVFQCLFGTAVRDGVGSVRTVLRGDQPVSAWLDEGTDVAEGTVRGLAEGFRARVHDRRPARNPAGISARDDRVIRRYAVN